MDHKGPEHHYDEIECPGCGTFFQQGELQPETIHNSCPDCGYDLRSGTGGRPYRGQPSDINSEMTERNTPLDGASADRGGNPLQEGILANLKRDEDEDLEEIEDATEPKGLGTVNPIKDNSWKSGEISDRAMGRDEMVGSVRHANEKESEDEMWDEVVEDFENAKGGETEDLAEKVAAASWLENDGQGSNIPVEHLGWDIVDVVEPSKEHIEAANKYSMPLPKGITDNLHEALIKLNAWVENPEENGKLRPYKDYWSVIRPKVSSDTSIKIGVEDPHMADIINDVARTDNLSSLSKTTKAKKLAGPLTLLALPELIGGLAAGTAGIADVAGVVAPALAGKALTNAAVDTLEDTGGGPDYSMIQPTSKTATYGDDYEHPSSITRRVEDLENGGIDPHQRTDESNDDWAYDMLDVNEVGQSRDIRGDDYEKHNLERQVIKSNHENEKEISKALEQFVQFLPLIMEYFHSDESGMDDPIVKSIHEGLESEFPGYLDLAVPEEENQILIMLNEDNKKESKIAEMTGPTCFKCNRPIDGPGEFCAEHASEQDEQATAKQGPEASSHSVKALTDTWTQPALQQQQQSEINKALKQYGITASDTQGPHTDEQQAAVAEMLIEQGREDEIPNMLENPADYDNELAEIQNKDPMLGEDPEDVGMSPQEQMQGMGAPGMPGMGGPDGGMPGMPPGPPGPAPGIPDMGAPTPADLNPAGPGAMQPPVMASMLHAAFKYGSDNVAGKCPKCDSHTTKMLQQDGQSKCHSCGHQWQDKTFERADGDSSNSSTTASFYQSLNLDSGPETVMPSPVDTFNEPEEEMEVDDSSHTWKDESGEPLEEGKEYEIYAHDYEIPDVGRVKEIKPDAVVYEIESDGGLRTTIEIDRQEADLNGYTFAPTSGGSKDNPHGIEENLDTKNVTAPGQDSDLSTPHIQIGSSTKEATVGFWACPQPNCQFNIEGGDTEPGTCPYHDVPLVQASEDLMQGIYNEKRMQDAARADLQSFTHVAGKHYTPMEQRELIDEYGEARNADKLNLEGTHYAETDDDYFLFGC